MVLAVIVVVVTTAIAVEPLPKWEVESFRAVNDLPRFAEWPMRAMQQAGMLFALPVGAAILWFVVGHWRPPASLMFGGIVFGWIAARVIRAHVDRGRPGALLDNVSLGWRTPIDTGCATRSSTPIDDNRVSAAASRPIGRTPLQRDTHKVAEDRPQTEQKSAVDGDGISSRASRTRISAGVPDQSRCLRSIRGDRCAAGGRVPANREGSATKT
jgi:hypothetical protein